MEFKVRLVILEGESEQVVEDIVTLDKEFRSVQDLGLKVEEGKDILRALQRDRSIRRSPLLAFRAAASTD